MRHRHRPARPVARLLALSLTVTSVLASAGGSATAATASCDNWTGTQPPNPGANANSLRGVDVVSACDAWAVGNYRGSDNRPKTLIERWNGSSWAVVPSPSPGMRDNLLTSVRGVSPSNIWAVGFYLNGPVPRSLILHWNGRVWKRVRIPDLGSGFSQLDGVRAISASDAWAVGERAINNAAKTLILHWNGHAWKQVSAPSPGSESTLAGVAVTSAKDVWAVGSVITSNDTSKTLILHWNGSKWARAPSPDPASFTELDGVGATSSSNAWAVGRFSSSKHPAERTLILHWNGRTWSRVASPNVGGTATSNFLAGVTATSATNAWAVGGAGFGTLILRWNGVRWTRVRSPDLGHSELFAVAAGSASNAWAVGQFSDQGVNGALAAHLAASPAAGSPSACQGWVGGLPPSPGTSVNQLNAVAVISPCNAWAVGSYASVGGDQTLIEHWNGAAWSVVPSPHPGTSGSFLDGVRAVSPSSIWAVGAYFSGTSEVDLIVHWNGHKWAQVPGPSPGANPRLTGVSVVSAHDVWAVGTSEANSTSRTIILHWDGRKWTKVKSPNPGAENNLFSVTATSAADAWAVGVVIKNNRDRTMILHWNGHKWAQVKSPNPGILGEFLGSVSATSASNAWTVGEYANHAGRERTLILHWNGHQWSQVASPNPGGSRSGDILEGVAAWSSGNAWAVGSYINGTDTAQNVLILHWNGRKWTADGSPRPGIRNELFSVAASPGGSIWAVGDFSSGGPLQNLAFHCC